MVNRSKEQTEPGPPPTDIETELAALNECIAALKKLDRESQQRVLSYVKARFGIYLGSD